MDFTLQFLQEFESEIGRPLKTNISLKKHSRFQIGGPADFFFEAKNPFELKKSISIANKYKIPYMIVGEGTNLLFDDLGYRGLIIKNAVKGIKVNVKEETIEAYTGSLLKEIVEKAAEHSLGGLEVLAGIPGTLGGAISGNAGAYGKSISNFVQKGIIINEEGREKEIDREYFQFDYRWSRLKKTKEVLLSATLKLKQGSRREILKKIKEISMNRKRKHPPPDIPCAGSYFKNIKLPDGNFIPAGYLLEEVGAKTIKVGGAAVYEKHANFLINKSGASCKDILTLASILKEKVKQAYGFDLAEEVIYIKANPLDD